jgi:hypothetical protein
VIEFFLDEQLHAEPAYSLDPDVLRRSRAIMSAKADTPVVRAGRVYSVRDLYAEVGVVPDW